MSDEKNGQNGGYIKIPDEGYGYSKSNFSISAHYEDDLSCVLIPAGLIKDRIEKLALDITSDLEGSKGISTLCVLKGGFKFFSDLLDGVERMNRTKKESIPLSIDFIRLKSYQDGSSSGAVQVTGIDNLESLHGRDVLIVEDIIDTGKSMKRLLKHLEQFEPKSVRCASLLVKRTPHSSGYRPNYTGFEVPDKFVVGYALDYNDHFRDLTHVCVINENAIAKYASKK